MLSGPPVHDVLWSPNGKTIAYQSSGSNVTLIRADGTNKRVLVDSRDFSTTWAVAWAPDSQSLAMVMSPRGEASRNLYIVDCAGNVRQVTRDGNVMNVSWSPDGTTLAYDYWGRGIWAVPAAGGTPVELVPNGSGPSWSPDGSQIAFASGERVDMMGWVERIDVMASDGTARRTVFNESAVAPRWSPAGDRILMNTGGKGIVVLEGPDFLPRRIFDGIVGYPGQWSPDGTRIVFADSPRFLWVIGADGTGLTKVSSQTASVYDW